MKVATWSPTWLHGALHGYMDPYQLIVIMLNTMYNVKGAICAFGVTYLHCTNLPIKIRTRLRDEHRQEMHFIKKTVELVRHKQLPTGL